MGSHRKVLVIRTEDSAIRRYLDSKIAMALKLLRKVNLTVKWRWFFFTSSVFAGSKLRKQAQVSSQHYNRLQTGTRWQDYSRRLFLNNDILFSWFKKMYRN